jgi:hypothetical protein
VPRVAIALLALLALLALFVALGSVSVGGAEGFRRHIVSDAGASLAVPAAWIATDKGVSPMVIDELARQNPKLAPFLRSAVGSGSPVRFIALDPKVRDGFATNVNVVVVPVAAGITFRQYRQALAAELKSAIGSERVEQAVVSIGGARALRLRYRLRLTFGRVFTVQTLQYALLRAERSVVVTYTTLPRLSSTYAATFRRSAESIRFLW